MRVIWFSLGAFTLFLALLGAFLPLLPTVPFLLLSAFFFAESSPKVHAWLLNHKVFGKMIADWNERGAIDRRAKYFSTVSILLVIVVSVLLEVKLVVIFLQLFILSLALLFIWTRPDK